MATSHEKGARAERRIAEALDGERTGNTGRASADVRTRWLAVEVKERRALPGWLKRAILQAVSGAGATWLGIVVLHETGARYDDSIVVLRLKDFQDWFGELPASQPENS